MNKKIISGPCINEHCWSLTIIDMAEGLLSVTVDGHTKKASFYGDSLDEILGRLEVSRDLEQAFGTENRIDRLLDPATIIWLMDRVGFLVTDDYRVYSLKKRAMVSIVERREFKMPALRGQEETIKQRLEGAGYAVERVEREGRFLGVQITKDGQRAHAEPYASVAKAIELCELEGV